MMKGTLNSARLSKWIFYGAWVLAFLMLIIRMRNIFIVDSFGDEGFYLKEYVRLQDNGLWAWASSGASYLYGSLYWLFAKIIGNPLIGGRVLSVCCSVGVFWMVVKIIREMGIKRLVMQVCQFTLLVTMVCYRSSFYWGINDVLLWFLSLISVFYLIKYFKTTILKHLLLSVGFLALTFSVKITALMLIPGWGLGLLLYFIVKKYSLKQMVKPLIAVLPVFTLLFALPQIPTLVERKTIGFEDKQYDDWRERNWLTHIYQINAGSLFTYGRVSLDEVERYRAVYGEETIPQSFMERIIKDPKFFVDNFITKLSFRSVYILLLHTGLFFLLVLNYIRIPEKIRMKQDLELIMLIFTAFIMVAIASLYIVHNVEHRWLTLAVLLLIVSGGIVLNRLKKTRVWINMQYAVLSIFLLTDLVKIIV